MAVTAEVVDPMLVGDEEKKVRPPHACSIWVRARFFASGKLHEFQDQV
jgi:hypothetical protein